MDFQNRPEIVFRFFLVGVVALVGASLINPATLNTIAIASGTAKETLFPLCL